MTDNNKLDQFNTILDENRNLVLRLLAVQEAEHRHLVSLLHDDFGQTLVAIKSFATAISHLSDNDMPEARDLAGMITELSQDIYQSAYDLMRELRAGLVTDLEFQAGVENCIQSARLEERNVKVQSHFHGNMEQLDGLIKVLTLRTIQECLTIIMRNGQPSQISLTLRLDNQSIDERRQFPRREASHVSNENLLRDVWLIEITSDGAGIDENISTAETFLQNTRDRVSALGGDFALECNPGQGWSITVRLDVTEFMLTREN